MRGEDVSGCSGFACVRLQHVELVLADCFCAILPKEGMRKHQRQSFSRAVSAIASGCHGGMPRARHPAIQTYLVDVLLDL